MVSAMLMEGNTKTYRLRVASGFALPNSSCQQEFGRSFYLQLYLVNYKKSMLDTYVIITVNSECAVSWILIVNEGGTAHSSAFLKVHGQVSSQCVKERSESYGRAHLQVSFGFL